MASAINQGLQTLANMHHEAQQRLAEIVDAKAALDAAGMYPAVPTQDWQARGADPDDKRYLYLCFPADGDGGYTSPTGKRKVYIGVDPDKQAEAVRLARNRRRFEDLERQQAAVQGWIASLSLAIESACNTARWRRPRHVFDRDLADYAPYNHREKETDHV